MAETIKDGKWTWYTIPVDLEEQSGYTGVTIDPRTVTPVGCFGITKSGNKFSVTWVANRLMMISLSRDEPILIEAFATVVEYKPYCKYRSKVSGLITYEWDKEDPKGRFAELQQGDGAEELELLVGIDELDNSEEE